MSTTKRPAVTRTRNKVRRFKIAVIAGPDEGKSVVTDGATTMVGQHSNNDLQIADKGVSRYHLEIEPRGEGLVVKDLDSTNGTFYGTKRVKSVIITPPARLRLGSNTVIEISAEERRERPR